MDLGKRIEKIGKYFISMNVAPDENTLYMFVQVRFPERWSILSTTNSAYGVTCTKDENNYGYYFWAENSNAEKIFDAIDATIKTNEDAIAKINLLMQKIEELKTIFANEENDLQYLSTLEFKFNTSKGSTKSKSTRSSKKTSIPETKTEETMVVGPVMTNEDEIISEAEIEGGL